MRAQTIDGMVISSDNEIRVGRRIHGSGTVTRTFEEKPKREMCNGCYDEFYQINGGMSGTGCWSFPKAQVCNKVGHSSIHVPNGPDTKMVKTLTCWHGVNK